MDVDGELPVNLDDFSDDDVDDQEEVGYEIRLRRPMHRRLSNLINFDAGLASPHEVSESIITSVDRIHGLDLLEVSIIDSDGGEYGSSYKVGNLLQADNSVYCSCKRSNITVIFEHNASALFVLTHFVLRAPPKGNFTAPIADAVLFVSQTPLTIKGLQEYDDYTRAEYDSLLQEKNILGKSLSEDEPAGFLSIDNTTGRTIVHTLSVPRTGRYIGVKFLRSTAEASSNANIDVEYVGFKGFTEVKGFAEGTIR
eukprot:m.849029 g.849029  ORF g.849029 m.849029 type:complete len:254 (-) comp23490_c2_seq26:3288-4049(-)